MKNNITTHEVMTLLGDGHLSKTAPTKQRAWVAPVQFSTDGHPTVLLGEQILNDDIYDLLHESGAYLASKHDALAFWTCGWASPVTDDEDDEVPPSLHPLRRRVALLCLVTKQGEFATVMRMYGEHGNEDMVETNGRGQLRESALSLYA